MSLVIFFMVFFLSGASANPVSDFESEYDARSAFGRAVNGYLCSEQAGAALERGGDGVSRHPSAIVPDQQQKLLCRGG
jgi:hypothetical protein